MNLEFLSNGIVFAAPFTFRSFLLTADMVTPQNAGHLYGIRILVWEDMEGQAATAADKAVLAEADDTVALAAAVRE